MKQFLVILFFGLLLVGCGSKKTVVRHEPTPHKERPARVESKKETVSERTESTEVVSTKSRETTTTKNYIEMYSSIAQEEMKLYGIPASITLAQGILESASGNGRLAMEANNHFGIKCHEWTGAKIYHDDDHNQECFRKYNDAKYSFRDHSLFLTERSRYSGLFDLRKDDYKAWAKGLRAAGYATDKKYPEKLIDLIERYQLYKFDEVTGGDQVIVKTSNKTQHIVVKGDTLYSISRQFNLTVEELQELNNLDSTGIKIGQVLKVKSL